MLGIFFPLEYFLADCLLFWFSLIYSKLLLLLIAVFLFIYRLDFHLETLH